MRHQRKTVHNVVIFASEKLQKHLPQFIYSVFFHDNFLQNLVSKHMRRRLRFHFFYIINVTAALNLLCRNTSMISQGFLHFNLKI